MSRARQRSVRPNDKYKRDAARWREYAQKLDVEIRILRELLDEQRRRNDELRKSWLRRLVGRWTG